MIIEVKLVTCRVTHKSHKKVIVVKCDHCGKIQEKRFQASTLKLKTQFCNPKCSAQARKVDGINYERWRSNCNSDTMTLAREKTMLERYGVKSSFEFPNFQEMSEKTSLENWGVTHPMKSKEMKTLHREVMVKRHGVTNAYQIKHVQEKSRATQREKFGVEHYMQTDTFKTLVRSPEFQKQRHETLKQDGSYGKSKFEDAVYAQLSLKFPDIQRQVYINGWSIDLFIPEPPTYVQVDGMYWHGLDRPREVIEASSYPRDEVILSTLDRDKQQVEWFASQNMCLLRFTDKHPIDEIIEAITLHVTNAT